MRLLAALVALVACFAVASAQAASSPIAGVYQLKITNPRLSGTWQISFSPTGAYAVSKAPKTKTVLIGGTSTTSGHKLVMVDKSGPGSCQGAAAKGTYTWSLSGKSLKLSKVKDTCSGRPDVLTGGTWTKVG
jgi:hypothetical protein